VAVVVVAEAGTVTAAIAAAVAAETAAGNSDQHSKVARKPGCLEAPRFHFLDCQGTHFGLCFP
jgi:predicted enzyme related to lactoylglutathione lyase